MSTHAHSVTVAHVRADTHANTKCFVSQGCSRDVKRVRISDTLLQLASLHMPHTQSHTCTQSHIISLISVSLPLSFPPFLSTMKSLRTSSRWSKQIWLQRPAPHRAGWHTGRGSKTHRHTGQDTKHQHHPNPSLLEGSKPSHPLQKYQS